MQRSTVIRLHAAGGTLALALIATFFTSTVAVELAGAKPAVAAVKQWIVYGLFILVPAMIVAGGTGHRLAGQSRARVVLQKRKRTMVAAANGLLVLVPCALVLDHLASHGAFSVSFYAVQAVELVAGSVNIALLGLNMRAGLRMSGRLPKRTTSASCA